MANPPISFLCSPKFSAQSEVMMVRWSVPTNDLVGEVSGESEYDWNDFIGEDIGDSAIETGVGGYDGVWLAEKN